MLNIKDIPIKDLKQYENNARKNDKAVPVVAESIRKYGFKVPVVVDKDNVIIAGHTRVMAAEELGLETVPAVIADDLTEDQAKAFRLADNKTAELAAWDFDRLEEELDQIDDEYLLGLFERKLYEEGEEYDGEIDLSDYDDEEFQYECPDCGFRFNP